MSWIFREVEQAVRAYATREPYELLDAIGAVTRFSRAYPADSLKGYCTILNGVKYAVVNANLSREEQRVVAGHEAAHLILHQSEMLLNPMVGMRDFNRPPRKPRP